MATYEYKCCNCNHEFETEQKMTDEPLRGCPKCLVDGLRRQIPGKTGFVLKGDTWAKDGYSSKGKNE